MQQAEELLAKLQEEIRSEEKEAQDQRAIAGVLSLLVPLVRKKAPREQVRKSADADLWLGLLGSPDAKVRKNTARVIGELYREDAPALLAGRLRQLLSEETVQMVRPSYILSLGAMGYGALLDDYSVPEGTLEKHAAEEKEALRKVRLAENTSKASTDRFLDIPFGRPLILVTAAGDKRRKIPSSPVWEALQQDRTWLEILVPIAGPEEIPSLCERCLKGGAPYRYRIEWRTSQKDRSREIRRLINQIEEIAGSALINDPSHYEIEVRVIQDRAAEAKATWYLKFSCAPDHRFDYRKEAIPASIHPANAAMIMQLAKPYLEKETGHIRRILDPCCGSGTLLIERAKMADEDSELVGLDIESRAVRAAKANMAEAFKKEGPDKEKPSGGWHIERTDLARWSLPEGERPFDEIYANLPFGIRVGDHGKNEALYEALAKKISEWLAPDGTAALYTMEGHLLEQKLKASAGLAVCKQVRLYAGGLSPRLYIVKKIRKVL